MDSRFPIGIKVSHSSGWTGVVVEALKDGTQANKSGTVVVEPDDGGRRHIIITRYLKHRQPALKSGDKVYHQASRRIGTIVADCFAEDSEVRVRFDGELAATPCKREELQTK
jgi:hypothetical protein